jgi:hypothetical protein
MRKDTENWIAMSDYDVKTARHMLESCSRLSEAN